MEVKIWIKRKFRHFLEKRNFWSNNIFVWSLIILCLIIAICIYQFMLMPQIHLKGKKEIIINYKEKYKEKGYKASFLGNDITEDVVIKGKINSNKLGTYKLIYKVKAGVFEKTVTRKIIVKDKEKPKLDIDDSDIYLCPGDELVPAKVNATDNYDKDLTKKIQTIISKDKSSLTYEVEDSSGNKSEVIKKVIYKDKESPVITLNQADTLYSYIGDTFEDPGVTVEDNCDSSLSEKVTTTGEVLTNQVGEYELTYTVSDAAGNKSQVTRKVIVREKSLNGVVYLTFDDGPNSGTTNVILDILKEEGVSATFFVTSKGPDELIKREFDEGHTVALHTSSHDYATVYASDEAFFNDLQTVHDRVERITGQDSRIIRFPGGSSNTISRRYSSGIMSRITQEVLRRGYKYYDWNVSSGDAAGGSPSPETIYNNVVNNLRHDRVNMVLMHDIKTYTRDALRNIIQYCKENGYPMEKITMDTEMITQKVNN